MDMALLRYNHTTVIDGEAMLVVVSVEALFRGIKTFLRHLLSGGCS